MFEETYLSGVLLDLGLEFAGISTNDLGDFFAINKDEESRHGTDFTGLSNIGNFIDIDLTSLSALSIDTTRMPHLDKLGLGVLGREFLKLWGNHLARATPDGMEVDNGDARGRGSLELGGARDSLDHFVCIPSVLFELQCITRVYRKPYMFDKNSTI